MKKDKNLKNNSNKKGFTLVEALVALFAFSVLVSSVAGVYVEFLDAQRKSISVQRRLEDLQNVSNFVSKTARTSVLKYPTSGNGTAPKVVLFDRTRPLDDANCIEFNFTGTSLTVASANAATEADCSDTSSFSPVSITDSQYNVTGSFYFRAPDPGVSVGFLAVSLQGCDPTDGSACSSADAYSSATKVQSAASMRP